MNEKELRKSIDDEVLAIFDKKGTPRAKQALFAKLKRLPTIEEVRYDFTERPDDADTGREWFLDPHESIQVLLERLEELEGAFRWAMGECALKEHRCEAGLGCQGWELFDYDGAARIEGRASCNAFPNVPSMVRHIEQCKYCSGLLASSLMENMRMQGSTGFRYEQPLKKLKAPEQYMKWFDKCIEEYDRDPTPKGFEEEACGSRTE